MKNYYTIMQYTIYKQPHDFNAWGLHLQMGELVHKTTCNQSIYSSFQGWYIIMSTKTHTHTALLILSPGV